MKISRREFVASAAAIGAVAAWSIPARASSTGWRERRELWLPRIPGEKIAEIENTLEYPAAGSATGTGRKH